MSESETTPVPGVPAGVSPDGGVRKLMFGGTPNTAREDAPQ